MFNEQAGISVESNLSFNVKFAGNNVAVTTNGHVSIKTKREEYRMLKFTPDMVIKNLIVTFGPKRIYWQGEVTLKDNQFSATLEFTEQNHENVVFGTVYRLQESQPNSKSERTKIIEFEGKAGDQIFIIETRKQKKEFVNVASTYLFCDLEKTKQIKLNSSPSLAMKRPKIHYLPPEKLDPMASTILWKQVSQCIIDNEMEKAGRRGIELCINY